jgi:hypothetical protein
MSVAKTYCLHGGSDLEKILNLRSGVLAHSGLDVDLIDRFRWAERNKINLKDGVPCANALPKCLAALRGFRRGYHVLPIELGCCVDAAGRHREQLLCPRPGHGRARGRPA